MVSGACFCGVSLLSREKGIGRYEKWMGPGPGSPPNTGFQASNASAQIPSAKEANVLNNILLITAALILGPSSAGVRKAEFFDLFFFLFGVFGPASGSVGAQQIPVDSDRLRVLLPRQFQFSNRF